MTDSSDRHAALSHFVAEALADPVASIAPASADASFRSYWRVTLADGSTRIVMDAPPDKENLEPWLGIGARLHAAGLHVPEVFATDRTQGFILMEDLGARAYLPELNTATANALYADALEALLRMQTRVDPAGLPPFDEAFLRMELGLMPEWFLQRHLGVEPSPAQRATIDAAFDTLVAAVREQPQGFMHRDYHSRNLMVVESRDSELATGDGQPQKAEALLGNPGIIDFQGAVIGPITYDLASLLRDCYIAWEPERVEGWLESYRQRLVHAHLLDTHVDAARFRRWFDLTGLQRHIKVLGLFCRLCYRDGKAQYLDDLPLVWRYVISVACTHAELAPLADLLEDALGSRDIARSRGIAA
ncbi:aminoglycoside phosphotransferase family protein [Dokdonella ginsengisoli]|uniref:Aminoglycoside phosphotransferase family protein n=1 Tax=Dokdonella ginsengisoli TaxID=363846 RepID=A0ABV9QPU2_9GAMM